MAKPVGPVARSRASRSVTSPISILKRPNGRKATKFVLSNRKLIDIPVNFAMEDLLFGRFRKIRLLGEGGFGQTILVEDVSVSPPGLCVLKILKFQDDPRLFRDATQRFQREAEVQKALSVKAAGGIARVFDFFAVNNCFVLVQEWIDGETLGERVLKRRLDETDAVSLMGWTLKLLKILHNHPIPVIHRDVKPQNLMLRRNTGQVVLIDFGAVKECTSVHGQSSSIAIGTQGYMAIEQVVGRPVFATDIFGLGMTVLFALTGLAPGQFTDPRQGKVFWPEHIQTVSPAFWKILRRCTEPNLTDRYGACEEVEADLNRLLGKGASTSALALAVTLPAVPLPATEVYSPGFESYGQGGSGNSSKWLLLPAAAALFILFGGFLWFAGSRKETAQPMAEASTPAPANSDAPPAPPTVSRADWFPLIGSDAYGENRKPARVSAKVKERLFTDFFSKVGSPSRKSSFPSDVYLEVLEFRPEIQDTARGSFTGPERKEILYTVIYDSGASHADYNKLFWLMVYDQNGLVLFRKVDSFNILRVYDVDGDGTDEIVLSSHYQNTGHVWVSAEVVTLKNGRYDVIRDFGEVYFSDCYSGLKKRLSTRVTSVDARFLQGKMEFRTQKTTTRCRPEPD